eukprot:TRINITY_DN1742_c0_g1_i1.p1 TRINITY_DN1742_c0_g1~~TRINITY_DN1742_c0_g1_i1.p1  ORF type:complete len:616 (+),score=157.55 TRINITY_DN1742_c0_g1_i1:232-2079(+)
MASDPNNPGVDQNFGLLSRSRSAPNTPRGADVNPYFNPELLGHAGDEYSKEVQIALLHQRLEFMEKQLEEKDRQLEHLKGLCKTLQDLLDVAGQRRNSSTTPTGATSRPPPGFESPPTNTQQPPIQPTQNQNSIKNRKFRSFHNDHYQSEGNSEDNSSDANQKKSWRKPAEENPSSSPPKEPITPRKETKESVPRLQINTNVSRSESTSQPPSPMQYKITKSVSHYSLSTFGSGDDSHHHHGPVHSNARFSPTTPTRPITPTSDAKSQANKSHLKKSQSMTNVYSVLEENRLDSKFPDLSELVGQIYALSKYQQGCRFLQKKLEEKSTENSKIILHELSEHLVELMTDPFGNYLFSKLMENIDEEQRGEVVKRILPEMMNIAFDMYGTQSLQKMMPFLNDTQITPIVSSFKNSAIALIKHNKANYLVQYCLDNLSPKHNQWIYDAVCGSLEEVSRDRVGCVIVKRCLDHSNQEQRARLIQEVSKHVIVLVQDPFGNYVVQHILEKAPQEPQAQILIRNLLGQVTTLCTGKFSSNVVEKCLKVADIETRRGMLTEITESETLPQLLNDRFANFVIQTALDVAEPEQRQTLVKNILPHLGRHYSPYTKRLQKKILQV